MLCAAGVDDHAMDYTGLLDDLVDDSGDIVFVGHICFQSMELSRETLCDGCEVVSGFADVYREDVCCAVVQT